MDVAYWLAATAAGLAGAVYLYRQLRAILRPVWRSMRAAARIVEHELTHNGGSSIKDDVHRIAVAVGSNQAILKDLIDRVTALEKRDKK